MPLHASYCMFSPSLSLYTTIMYRVIPTAASFIGSAMLLVILGVHLDLASVQLQADAWLSTCINVTLRPWVEPRPANWITGAADSPSSNLGFDKIYLIHLLSRRDREARLQALSTSLNLEFTLSPAVPAQDPSIKYIMQQVQKERKAEGWCEAGEPCTEKTFARHASLFLEDAYRLQRNPEAEELKKKGSDLWFTASIESPPQEQDLKLPSAKGTSMRHVLIDRRDGLTIPLDHYNQRPFYPLVQPEDVYTWLSSAAIACWHSHVLTLRKFIDSGEESALIIEDDIDMEVS